MMMKKRAWPVYLLWIFFTEAVGFLSALLTRQGVAAYRAVVTKPPLTPPALVFPIVWAILYFLMGVGMARVWLTGPSDQRSRALGLFALQLAVNFFWSLVFFNRQAFGFAFVLLLVLWGLIFRMLHAFRPLDVTAARLQIPYLVWVTFAGYLTLGVWYLNR